jgi:hypothetical protein
MPDAPARIFRIGAERTDEKKIGDTREKSETIHSPHAICIRGRSAFCDCLILSGIFPRFSEKCADDKKNTAILARVLHPERLTEPQFSWYAKYRFRYFSAPESTRSGCSSRAGRTLGNEGETRYSAVRFLHLPHSDSAIKITRISVRCQ